MLREITKEELKKRERCARLKLCQSCEKPLKGKYGSDDWHTPYWIPLCHGWFWCTECFNRPDPKVGHAYCPHNKDPHRHDAEDKLNREHLGRNYA
jgi:hypothetical protein